MMTPKTLFLAAEEESGRQGLHGFSKEQDLPEVAAMSERSVTLFDNVSSTSVRGATLEKTHDIVRDAGETCCQRHLMPALGDDSQSDKVPAARGGKDQRRVA